MTAATASIASRGSGSSRPSSSAASRARRARPGGEQGRQVRAGGGGRGPLGGAGQPDRVGVAAGERGGGGPGQLADDGDEVDGRVEAGQPPVEDPLPERVQRGHPRGAQQARQLASGGAVFGALLVEEQAAAGEPGGGAAGGARGRPVERDAGEHLAVGVRVVDQHGAAEPEHRPVPGRGEQGEQQRVAAQVDRAVGAPRGRQRGLRAGGVARRWAQ
ncbi:hypothetical protein HUT16_18700 [Kitasatospora sp. NA04385]|uniref:hypothetical protein n=1 Tax=Kitasatospora sp. NA04385 TaxID=2742135 RepID=UPI00158FA750|nr:hypothetical protein [Kitasatospora sp. NA04385]QKW20820.1 hypothetical protein HUT16_18700 [Kitasatospora sp. NA04385]